MAWPIAEVARMSGVTARTLRHYDETGLLPPARIGSNGHRYLLEGTKRSAAVHDDGRHDMHLHARIRGD